MHFEASAHRGSSSRMLYRGIQTPDPNGFDELEGCFQGVERCCFVCSPVVPSFPRGTETVENLRTVDFLPNCNCNFLERDPSLLGPNKISVMDLKVVQSCYFTMGRIFINKSQRSLVLFIFQRLNHGLTRQTVSVWVRGLTKFYFKGFSIEQVALSKRSTRISIFRLNSAQNI